MGTGTTANGMALPRSVWIVAAAVSVAATAFAAAKPVFATDTLCRYAFRAEAFSSGNWAEAFHPRFGVGLPVVAGLARLVLRTDGLSACAAVSMLAWSVGLVPLWLIADRLFDRRTAWFAVVLYLICPQIALWGLQGLREPFKMLGALMMVCGLVTCRERGFAAVVWATAGSVLLVTFKPDAIPLAGILSVGFAVCDRFGRKTWAVLAGGALALVPMCWLTWSWTGFFVPSTQYVKFICKFIGG